MQHIIVAGIAALTVGFVAGWALGVVVPAGGGSASEPEAAAHILRPALEHASGLQPVATEPDEQAAARSDAPIIAREALATETAARAPVLKDAPNASSPPVPARSSNSRAPPLILGIRH